MGPLKSNGKKNLVSEINVTPLVDVMLVLLIIFMVTAPMMTQGVNIDLPETTSKALRQEEDPIVVNVNKEGAISIKEIPLDQALLVQELQKSYAVNKDQTIYLYADTNVAYGKVMSVMDAIKTVGFDKVGMVTKPPEKE